MPENFEDVWQVATPIEGWLTKDQGRALFDAARSVPQGLASVEIGSHRGKSAVIIASGLPAGVTLTAVDPFDDPRWGGGPESLEIFRRNVGEAGVGDRIEQFRGLSEEASDSWDGPKVGFLWVDGAHDLESTLKDFDGWRPHMAQGGRIYVHDAFSAVGTTRAILRRFWFSRDVSYLGCERTLVKFEVRSLSLTERLRSGFALARRLPFFARMIAIKVSRRRGLKGLERRFMKGSTEPLI